MPVFKSRIQPRSAEFQANREHMEAGVAQVREIEKRVLETAEAKIPRYRKRGYISPRERLNLLLDPGAPFLELYSLAGYMQGNDTDGSAAGGTCIAGIGYVKGTRCAIYVDDYLTKGGSISRYGAEKRMNMQMIALNKKMPFIVLAQSAGGDLREAGDMFGASGKFFANQARLSAAGIPQITVVHGSATAGGAYQPGLSDYIVMIRRQSTVYLAGPPLLKAATGEIATDEEIGGAELHCQVSGVSDYMAENDADGIRLARQIMEKIQWNKNLPALSQKDYAAPVCPPEEMIGIVPVDPKVPYDCREIMARIADGSDILDFKADYDAGTVCAFMEVHGQACGVLGNNAPITSDGAAKATQFMQLCEQSDTPLVFLHNTTGFLVGTEAESRGIIKHGSKMIQAVTNTTVPKISFIVGGSYGAGNYAMCGRGMDPDFVFAWPRSVVSIMGPAQAGSVLRQVAHARMEKMGQVDENFLDQIEADTRKALEERSHALANTARLWDDGLIDPRDTRSILGFVLDICHEAKIRRVKPNTFGIARM
ncbi:MAG: acyl-CoA carboxylase subunit beta [Desulfobacteraceae bacterium]|nr:acyl-CoA carboxylase subunit beta [Desulfobacteraceae bacterium]